MALEKSFQKLMTRSFAKCMTVPARFVRTYYYEFDHYMAMQMLGDSHLWYVKVNLRAAKNRPHVSFEAGWKKFMRRYHLQEGHRLKFTLSQTSVFQVTHVGQTVGVVRPTTTQQGGGSGF